MINDTVVLPSPQRWDRPFDPEMSDEAVDRVLLMEPFSQIDASRFKKKNSLHSIIKNDARIVKYRQGDIIMREGDYGSSAFFVLSGDVQVVLSPSLSAEDLGRREREVKGMWGAFSQLWTNSITEERRDPDEYAKGIQQTNGANISDRYVASLSDVDAVKKNHKLIQLSVGDMFGELAALSRTPRTASIFADENIEAQFDGFDVEVLELRWEGLRDIRNQSEGFKNIIDERYRERSLTNHLIKSEIFRHITDKSHIDEIVAATKFETYGNFNWYAPFKTQAEKSESDQSEKEPQIAIEDHYINSLILIRAGFARQSQQLNNGRRTLSYLGNGDFYGLNEIVHNWKSQENIPLQSSLSAMGYVDTLKIPIALIEKYVLPGLPDSILLPILENNKLLLAEKKEVIKLESKDDFREFLVKNRFINGTKSMLIDMDRCTRCDDCVRACAAAHDNNPRFIRHGKQHDNIMVANSCMHCNDPVCMIGCPTGAIHRDAFKGQVVINDDTCIGCGTCATSCPYNNIRIVQVRDKKGNFIINESTHQPIEKATKCDLCIDQQVSPACERACPHDALARVDMGDSEKLTAWLNR